MAKKRISDLIHEEAQNLPDSDGTPVIEVVAQEVLEQDAEPAKELPINATEQPTVSSKSPTKAELEATVAELKAALEQGSQKESLLQQQIADLRADLDEQKTFVKKLQKELEQAKPLKAELEQVKKAAVQLAEANSKLIEEANGAKANGARQANDAKQAYGAKEAKAVQKERSDIQPSGYRKSPGKLPNYAPPLPKEPADFAANSWLLD